jgi:hypothetical protein
VELSPEKQTSSFFVTVILFSAIVLPSTEITAFGGWFAHTRLHESMIKSPRSTLRNSMSNPPLKKDKKLLYMRPGMLMKRLCENDAARGGIESPGISSAPGRQVIGIVRQDRDHLSVDSLTTACGQSIDKARRSGGILGHCLPLLVRPVPCGRSGPTKRCFVSALIVKAVIGDVVYAGGAVEIDAIVARPGEVIIAYGIVCLAVKVGIIFIARRTSTMQY